MAAKKHLTQKNFYPILFALYPVLFLMSANLGEIPVRESWRAIFVVILISLLLWALLGLILRNTQKAALITTFLIIAFFSYGHLYNYLGQDNILNGTLRRHRYLIPFFVGIILLSSWWVTKKSRNFTSITSVFNTIGLVLLVFPLYQITSFEIRSISEGLFRQGNSEEINTSTFSSINIKPDIYYIILDAYGREDALLEQYHYDNSPFLNELRDMGFFVADCSSSNYERTQLSLSSSLNMDYIEKLGGNDLIKDFEGNLKLEKIKRLIVDNETRRILEANHYTTVAFQTGFNWTQWENADYYFSYTNEIESDWFTQIFSSFNVFESLLLETSAGQLVYDLLNAAYQNNNERNQAEFKDETRQIIRYNNVKYTLDKLEEIPSSIRSPKFVFVHLLSPHQPFVFDPEGEFISDVTIQKSVEPGYFYQIAFLNKRLLTIVEKIINTSDSPPIIIIQGDHGPPETKYTPLRLQILNAYYLPDGGDEDLYASITPVNSFRVIFDHYFGTQYGLLEDVSRNSTEGETLNLTIVPNTCEAK